jgi:acyl-CoA dehydrogenase
VDEPELREILDTVREFVRNVVVPAEEDIESADEIHAEIRGAAAAMGLYGFAIPAEYGGLGLSLPEEVRLVFELGYAAPAFRSLFGTNNGIAATCCWRAAPTSSARSICPRWPAGSGRLPSRSPSRKRDRIPRP